MIAQHDESTYNNHPVYIMSTILIIRTIKDQLGHEQPVIALVVKETGIKTRERLLNEGAIVVQVDTEAHTPKHQIGKLGRYVDQFGKLVVWNFTDYSQIIFMDSDVVIKGDVRRMRR
jgi:alpha-N-acetylglucosamine transferase